MRKSLAILLAMCLSLGMIGCGSSSAPKEDDSMEEIVEKAREYWGWRA